MIDDAELPKRGAAPYVSFSTFKNFVGSLKEHVMPTRIDKSLMKSFAGGVQAQLMTALKFMNLIDQEGKPGTKLERLVIAYGTDTWSSVLKDVLQSAYGELMKADLQRITPSDFNESFKKAYPCEGDTLRKSTAFFLNASRETDISISKFLQSSTKPRASAGRRKARAPQSTRGDGFREDDSPPPPPPPSPLVKSIPEQLLSKFPDFDPSWNEELKAKWFEGYEKLLALGEKNRQ